MLRCSDSLASWLLEAFDTFATARFRLSAIYPKSSFVPTSARAFPSPAASRSENSDSSFTGDRIELPSLQASTMLMPTASARAKISPPLAPLGIAPRSNIDAPLDWRPALKASPKTTKTTTPFKIVSVQIVLLSRDFITFLPSSFLNYLDTRPRIHFQQPAQIQHQRQPVLVSQHSHAMRHVFRCFLQQILGFIHRIRPHNFIRGDAQPQIIVMSISAQRCHHNMLRQQSRPAAFCQRNVNQRDDRSPQIENAQNMRRRKRQLRHQRPFQNLFHIQHRETESFTAASEHAVLRFRLPVRCRTERLKQLPNLFIRGQGGQLEFIVHRWFFLPLLQANRRTARKRSSLVNGLVM